MKKDFGRDIGSYKDLEYSEFFDPLLCTVDLDCFVKYMFDDLYDSERRRIDLIERIHKICGENKPSELARGHDLTKLLAMHITCLNGNGEVCFSDVERELRLHVDAATFWAQNFGITLRSFISRASR